LSSVDGGTIEPITPIDFIASSIVHAPVDGARQDDSTPIPNPTDLSVRAALQITLPIDSHQGSPRLPPAAAGTALTSSRGG
ncbi:MAG: hypothetical protein KA759_16975, partial [Zoogloea sp.]|nr:hypothetical protein [Zoogloea sp.]